MPSWIYTRARHTVHKRNTHTRALGQNTHIDSAATSAHNTHVQQNLDMYSNINIHQTHKSRRYTTQRYTHTCIQDIHRTLCMCVYTKHNCELLLFG